MIRPCRSGLAKEPLGNQEHYNESTRYRHVRKTHIADITQR